MDLSVAQIICDIIGTVGTIIVAIIGTRLTTSAVQTTRGQQQMGYSIPPQVKTKQIVAATLMAVSAVLFVCVALYGYLFFIPNPISACPDHAQTSVNINYPVDNQQVDQIITARGIACHVGSGQYVYLVALGEVSNVYYLLGPQLSITNFNTWARVITIGNVSKDIVGHSYKIMAVVVNDALHAQWTTIVANRKVAHTVAGIPSDAQTMFVITVIRK